MSDPAAAPEETPEPTQTTDPAPAEVPPQDDAGAEPAPEEQPAEAESAPEGDDQEQPEPEPKKQKREGGFQRKIARLEEQNAQLMEMLQRQVKQPAGETKKKTPEDEAADFLDKLVEKRLAEAEAKREAAQRQADFERRTQEVRAAHPDFDEVVQSVSHIPVPNYVNEALLTSEHGAAIMYELASNQAELARISALPPLAAAREIGRLETKVSGPAPKAKVPAAKRPGAPPPIVPVRTRGPTVVKDPSKMSGDEYIAWWNQTYGPGRR